MRRTGTRLVGSVAYFPERYGDTVIALALDKIRGKGHPLRYLSSATRWSPPPTLNPSTPNDNLITAGDGDSLLYSRH